ncbi:uncharacterized protein BXZ73DRAFT_46328 [Epithele typhae]|uniref:uncharacterized protein n=1 Tax=Epithele typhae TaxID=378194 RepID=UPI0020072C18|nr:uncharacterized protein BXZ73DRAFT_46328 [Epithele typhae]KAH9933565.1 hypothetical protein BXZ73DRAFT_46328 [Epithele typhae]
MSDKKYKRIDEDRSRRYPIHEPTSDIKELQRRLQQDPRFNPPTPSAWKRVALIVFLLCVCWFAVQLRVSMIPRQPEPPQVVHANRYSNEFKFRPAASPVVTEKMKDGRTRVRGAMPSFQ